LDDHEIRSAGEPRLVGVGELKVDVDVRDHLEVIRQLRAQLNQQFGLGEVVIRNRARRHQQAAFQQLV
jgi:hypothetical protein